MPASRAANRLDVKYCLIKRDWRRVDNLNPLSAFVKLKSFVGEDVVECQFHEKHLQLFTVTYDGTATPGRILLPRTDTEYAQLFRVRTGELVISNIAATYGSVAVVPPELDGLVVSKEYTVLQTKPEYDARVIRAILRSPEIRAELLLRTTGANRTRIRWADIQGIAFPYPDKRTVAVFVRHLEEAAKARAKALVEATSATRGLTETLCLDREQAHMILDAFKPPR